MVQNLECATALDAALGRRSVRLHAAANLKTPLTQELDVFAESREPLAADLEHLRIAARLDVENVTASTLRLILFLAGCCRCRNGAMLDVAALNHQHRISCVAKAAVDLRQTVIDRDEIVLRAIEEALAVDAVALWRLHPDDRDARPSVRAGVVLVLDPSNDLLVFVELAEALEPISAHRLIRRLIRLVDDESEPKVCREILVGNLIAHLDENRASCRIQLLELDELHRVARVERWRAFASRKNLDVGLFVVCRTDHDRARSRRCALGRLIHHGIEIERLDEVLNALFGVLVFVGRLFTEVRADERHLFVAPHEAGELIDEHRCAVPDDGRAPLFHRDILTTIRLGIERDLDVIVERAHAETVELIETHEAC